MITNEAGEVAIAYHQPAQAFVAGTRMPTRRAYVFVPQRAVSMAWVAPADVDELLAMRGGCCNQRQKLFDYATEGQVSMWQSGARGDGGNGCGC